MVKARKVDNEQALFLDLVAELAANLASANTDKAVQDFTRIKAEEEIRMLLEKVEMKANTVEDARL